MHYWILLFWSKRL